MKTTRLHKEVFQQTFQANYNLNSAITNLSELTSHCYLFTAHNCEGNNPPASDNTGKADRRKDM